MVPHDAHKLYECTCATPVHDSWHGPNAKQDKRTSAQRHEVHMWTTYAGARAHGGALLGPTDPWANEQTPPCVHFDDYCMRVRACVLALPGWEGV